MAEESGTLSQLDGSALSVAWSPGGQRLAVGGDQGSVRVWDVVTGVLVRSFEGPSGWVRSVAWRPDGRVLAAGDDTGTVFLWDTATGRERGRLTGHPGRVRSVAWSPDGRLLASAGGHGAGTVRVWDAATGASLATPGAGERRALAVAWRPDGRWLAVGYDDGAVQLVDVSDWKAPELTALDRRGWVRSVAWSPDGGLLVTAAEDGVQVNDFSAWYRESGEPEWFTLGVEPRPLPGAPDTAAYAAACDPGGTILAAGYEDGSVWLWDLAGGEAARLEPAAIPVAVRSLAWSPDGTALASAAEDGSVRLWDPGGGPLALRTHMGLHRPLAGLRSDAPADADLTGTGDDAAILAELIAAAGTAPPLAIALLGRWGAGKSSLMLQTRRQVASLAERSRRLPGRTAFAAHVRQITFNAWHYSDGQVWTGMIEHLFRALAEPTDTAPQDGSEARIAAERTRLRRRLDDLAAEDTALTGTLNRSTAPVGAARLVARAARETWRQQRARLGIALSWAVVLAAAYGLWRWAGPGVATPAGALGVLAAPVVAVAKRLRGWHGRVSGTVRKAREPVERRRAALRQEATEATARLAEVDAARRLAALIARRADPGGYAERRGLLGEVHADLDQLARDLSDAHEQWRTDPTGTPPLERIVLYIDDLDRCPPERVVEVLEAVHLMLSLPLFVVVVAVDPRWVVRALERHHRDYFDAGNGDVAGDRVATPLEYLDKIFQVTYAVPGFTPERARAYAWTLLTSAGEARPAPAPDAPADPDPGAVPAGRPPSGAPASPRASRPPEAVYRTEAEPSPPTARARSSAPGAGTAHGLSPDHLFFTAAETDALVRLAWLAPTPRALKRLINLYRLARITVRADELPTFLSPRGAHFQAVQVILLIMVAVPPHAAELLRAIHFHPSPQGVRDGLGDVIGVSRDDPAWNETWSLRVGLLSELSGDPAGGRLGLCDDLLVYHHWIPRLARFSFHTLPLAGGAD